MKEAKPPASSAEIEQIEDRLGLVLPESYKRFLLLHNGGRPEREEFDCEIARGGSSAVHFFSPISEGADDLELLVSQGRLRANLLPIASDHYGNLLCLDCSSSKYGRVFFWNHESEGVCEVSSDLDTFVESLYDSGREARYDRGKIFQHVRECDVARVAMYIKAGGDVDVKDKLDIPLIDIAAVHGHAEIVHALLDAGASGEYLLHIAAQNGHLELVKMLIARGSSINERREGDGETPLIAAALFGKANVVQLLLEHGADVSCKDSKGETALDKCRRFGYSEIAKLLQSSH